MTLQATAGYIFNTLLAMLVHRFIPVVAFEAVHVGIRAIVAARALPVGVTVPHGEGVTIDADITPIVGIVTLGTLPRPVIRRWDMARLTVCLAAVIKIGRFP